MCPKGWQQLLKPKWSLEVTCQSCSVGGISRGARMCPVPSVSTGYTRWAVLALAPIPQQAGSCSPCRLQALSSVWRGSTGSSAEASRAPAAHPATQHSPKRDGSSSDPTAALASAILLRLRSPGVTSQPPCGLAGGDRDAQLGHMCWCRAGHRPLPGPPGARGDRDAAEARPRCAGAARSLCSCQTHLCEDAELQSQSLSSLMPGSSLRRGMPRSSGVTSWIQNPVSRLARPHRHHRSGPAPGPLPASPRAAGTREEPVSLSLSRSPPPSLSPAAPGPAAPGSRRGLAAARGKRALWLPTAARLEEKARISWPGASPSRLLPAAESLGAEGGLFPTGFRPGARGCPCRELLLNAQGSGRQHGSGHFCWQCQNLPLCSILPINKIPAQAQPLASTEMCPLLFVHSHPQCATGAVAAGWPCAIAQGI